MESRRTGIQIDKDCESAWAGIGVLLDAENLACAAQAHSKSGVLAVGKRDAELDLSSHGGNPISPNECPADCEVSGHACSVLLKPI